MYVFDPTGFSEWPDPVGWDPVAGCEDPQVAIYRARALNAAARQLAGHPARRLLPVVQRGDPPLLPARRGGLRTRHRHGARSGSTGRRATTRSGVCARAPSRRSGPTTSRRSPACTTRPSPTCSAVRDAPTTAWRIRECCAPANPARGPRFNADRIIDRAGGALHRRHIGRAGEHGADHHRAHRDDRRCGQAAGGAIGDADG